MMQQIQVAKYHTFGGHKDCLYTLEPLDEQRFFSAGGDGMVVLWDLQELEKGTMVAKVPTSIYALHYIPEDDLLIVGQNYEGIHLIAVEEKEEKGSLKLTEAAIFDIKSDRHYIYVGTGEGELIVIDRKSLTIKSRVKESADSLRTLAISNKHITAGYSDNHIRRFDRLHFTLIQEVEAHENSVFSVVDNPGGNTVLSGSRDAHLKIWDRSSMTIKEDIVAHMYAINHIEFSPDGQHFVTCSMDKSIKVWDAATFKLKKVIDKARHAGHGTSVNKLLWMNYNNFLVSCSDDQSISVWDIKFGEK